MVRVQEMGVEMWEIRVCMWVMQAARVGIWRMDVKMLGIRLEMQRKWGKNEFVGMEGLKQGAERGKSHREYFC